MTAQTTNAQTANVTAQDAIEFAPEAHRVACKLVDEAFALDNEPARVRKLMEAVRAMRFAAFVAELGGMTAEAEGWTKEADALFECAAHINAGIEQRIADAN